MQLTKEPKTYTGKKPLVYYEVYGWKDLQSLANQHFIFEHAGEAIATCKRLVESGLSVTANVREEIVYKRTATCDFSESGAIFSI